MGTSVMQQRKHILPCIPMILGITPWESHPVSRGWDSQHFPWYGRPSSGREPHQAGPNRVRAGHYQCFYFCWKFQSQAPTASPSNVNLFMSWLTYVSIRTHGPESNLLHCDVPFLNSPIFLFTINVGSTIQTIP